MSFHKSIFRLACCLLASWCLPALLAQDVPLIIDTNTVLESGRPVDPSDEEETVFTFQPRDVVSFRILEDRTPASIRLDVSDAGEIEFPYVGRVKAEGKTPETLMKEVKVLLEKDYYYTATVELALFAKAPRTVAEQLARDNMTMIQVTVLGAVRAQGPLKFPENQPLKLTEAILQKGGFTDFSDQKRVKILRRKRNEDGTAVSEGDDSTQVEEIIVNVDEIWAEGKFDKDVLLQDGDLVTVPRKFFNF